MRILCCLDWANAEQMSRAVGILLRAEARTMAVLYVTDLLCNGWLDRNKRTADEHNQRTEHPLTYISLP